MPVSRCLEKGYRYPEITGWIRANKDDLQLVKDFGLKETGILTSCSDYHIFLKFKKTRSQVFKDYIKIVESALEQGIAPTVPFRRRDAGRYLRILRALCTGAHEHLRRREDPHQDPPVRHPGSRRHLSRRRASPVHREDHPGHDRRCGRSLGIPRMARPQ